VPHGGPKIKSDGTSRSSEGNTKYCYGDRNNVLKKLFDGDGDGDGEEGQRAKAKADNNNNKERASV